MWVLIPKPTIPVVLPSNHVPQMRTDPFIAPSITGQSETAHFATKVFGLSLHITQPRSSGCLSDPACAGVARAGVGV